MSVKRAAASLLFCLAAGAARAQASTDSAPITIDADNSEVDLQSKSVSYSGKVVVTQNEMRLGADTARAEDVEGNTARRITANGHVVFDSPKGTITADAGTFDVAPKIITFTGKVVLTRDKNVLRGNVLTYNIATGQAKFTAPGGRVQGLFAPPPGSNP